MLEEYEKVFIVPMEDNKYAQFKFRPYQQIKVLLDEYNIPYELGDNYFHNKIFINSQEQKIALYKIPCHNNEKRKYYMFFFTSNVIDKILDYYKIQYQKEEK